MRAVIYARYTSDNQRDASGVTLLQPRIQKPLKDCMANRVDLVVAESDKPRPGRHRRNLQAPKHRRCPSGRPPLSVDNPQSAAQTL